MLSKIAAYSPPPRPAAPAPAPPKHTSLGTKAKNLLKMPAHALAKLFHHNHAKMKAGAAHVTPPGLPPPGARTKTVPLGAAAPSKSLSIYA